MLQTKRASVKDRLHNAIQHVRGQGPLGLSYVAWIIIILVAAKIAAFIWLFNLTYVEPYGKLQPSEWWLVFQRWDSAFYERIATLGYVDLKDWAFFPAFPATIKFINFFIGSSSVSTSLAGLIFGLTWVPVYYKIGSFYMGEKNSAYSTLMFAFFPTVLLFTSVGYGEGLWLTFTLLGWYLYLKDKHALSSAALAVSALARVPGVVLPALLFLYRLKKRKFKQALVYVLPFLALTAWFLYGYTQTGELFAPVAAGGKTAWNPDLTFIDLFVSPMLKGEPPPAWGVDTVFIIMIISLFAYLSLKTFSVDKVLGFYSFSLLGLYLATAYLWSLSRFLPFTFPLWLNVKVKSKWQVAVYVVINFLLAILVWSEFLSDRWAG
ncbi:MAG: hypothetical protein ACE14S_08170 [Candidatus Bathyarchaeia archaeon]